MRSLRLALTLAPAPAPIANHGAIEALQPGELVMLSIVLAGDVCHASACARSITSRRYPRRRSHLARLVGVDLDVKAGTYPVTVDAGVSRARIPASVTPRVFRTRRLTVNEAFVTPPPSEQARIEREAALLADVWKAPAARAPVDAAFVRPVPQEANSAFGTRSIFNGKPRNAHGGADFLSPAGTPIKAPNAGRVVVARNLYFSGNTVIIDHGLGLFSMLAHLSAIDVHEGDRVTAGQLLGLVGATGRVTGPHLHWAVRASNARVDPLSLLALLGAPAAAP